MSKYQLDVLDEIKKTMEAPGLDQYNNETGYAQQIRRLHNLNHPTFNPIEELEEKLEEPSSSSQIAARQLQDPKIAEFIKEDLPAEGSIIEVYGRGGHTMHSSDIDATLRANGVSVMIVDPNRGAEDKTCAPNMPKDYCEVWSGALENIKREVKRDGDPNRYEMPDFKNDPTNVKKLTPDEIKTLMDKPDALRVSSAPTAAVAPESPAVKAQDPIYSV